MMISNDFVCENREKSEKSKIISAACDSRRWSAGFQFWKSREIKRMDSRLYNKVLRGFFISQIETLFSHAKFVLDNMVIRRYKSFLNRTMIRPNGRHRV